MSLRSLLRAMRQLRPLLAALGLLMNSAHARVPDANELMNWAEQAFPQYFPTHVATQTLSPYVYRFYAATQTYLGVAGSDVYVIGPISGQQLQKVGTLADFACSVFPADCVSDVAAYGRFQLVGLSSAGKQPRLLAVDPAPGTAATLLTPLAEGYDLDEVSRSKPPYDDSTASHAFIKDAASGRFGSLGAAMRFYSAGGRLYRIDLARGRAAQAAAVSSSRVCMVEKVLPLDGSGTTAWIVALDAGADGRCDTLSDNVRLMIRSDTPANQPAQASIPLLPAAAGHYPVVCCNFDVMRDAAGKALWFSGWEYKTAGDRAPTLRLYSAVDLSPGPVSNTIVGGFQTSPLKPLQGVRPGSTLDRVSWNAQGVLTVSNLYKRQGKVLSRALVTPGAIFVADDSNLVRVPDSGSPTVVATLPYSRTDADLNRRLNYLTFSQTPTRAIVAVQNAYLQTIAIGTAPIDGKGTGSLLVTSESEGGALTFLGVDGEAVVYAVSAVPTPGLPQLKLDRLMRISADGSGKSVVEDGVYLAGIVWSKRPLTTGVDDYVRPEISGVLMCRNAQMQMTCSDSDLLEYRPSSARNLLHGHIPVLSPLSGQLLTTHAIDGLPAKLGFNVLVGGAQAAPSVPLIRPGVDGSLSFATTP